MRCYEVVVLSGRSRLEQVFAQFRHEPHVVALPKLRKALFGLPVSERDVEEDSSGMLQAIQVTLVADR